MRLLVFLILVPFSVFAQTKQLTVENSTYPPQGFFPPLVSQIQWMGSSDKYCFVFKNKLISGKAGSEKRDTILTIEDINAAFTNSGDEPLKRFPVINFMSEDVFRFTSSKKYYTFRIKDKKLTYINSTPENAANADIEKKSNNIAYTRENNLYIAVEGRQKTITSEQDKGILYGSERVHRNEFGITKGTFWAPGGKKLAFYRMDETMVKDYPLVDIEPRIAELNSVKYPMAGMTSHQVTLGVYDLAADSIVYMKTDGDPEHYLTNITWSPDGKDIYIAELNRDQNQMQLNRYDAATGRKEKTLFEETSDKYVEPEMGPVFLTLDQSKFLWKSRKDGFDHLYLYDTAGTQIKQLTSGQWEVIALIGIDNKDKKVYFIADRESPLNQQLFSADISTGEILLISSIPGTHDVHVSDDGRFSLDKYSSSEIFSDFGIIENKTASFTSIFTAVDPLKDFILGETTVFTIKNEDNTDLYCRMIKPPDFDPSKKYPVVIYAYGGPHNQLVNNSWLSGGGLYLNFLATKGYIVFTLDNRGTDYRGAAFEQAIFRNAGTAEVADQMKGVEYLKSLPYVDPSRIGLNGWSYGGFLTMSMFLKNPGIFKVTIAGGPVIDWKFYEVMYGERYMDTPEKNPEGYKQSSLLNYVKNLTGKLLIIQGYQDETVVPQNSLSFIKKCVDENKQLDYFIYPAHEHNVRGKDRIHLNQKIYDYFKDNL